MMRLRFDRPAGSPLRLLLLGAHSDDIEIGCGGAVLELLALHPGSHVSWVVFSGSEARAAEARASAADFLAGAGARDVRTLDFPESFFPSRWADVKNAVEALAPLAPDAVFTHHRGDLHQDHRLLGELVWNSFRDHLILEYEIPKYEGDLGRPGAFVPLEAATVRRKCELIRKHFASQRGRHWFDDELFLAVMRLRGMECRAPSGHAEAFHARKLVIG
jgi:LmbE family N-acetylglucosaminyl deacetylase